MIILCLDEDLALPQPPTHSGTDMVQLKTRIIRWSAELGFQQIGVSDIDLSEG